MATKSMATALLVVAMMAASCAPGAHAATASIAVTTLTFVNELYDPLRVTTASGALSTTATVLIPAGGTASLPQYVDAPLTSPGIDFQVRDKVYNTPGSPHSRVVGETGQVKIYITGRCENGPGLQFVSTAATACTFLGCALPKKRT